MPSEIIRKQMIHMIMTGDLTVPKMFPDSHLIHQKKNRLHMRIRKVPFQTNLRKIQDRLLRYSTEEKRNMKKTGSLICKGLLLTTCRSGSLLD